MGLESFLSLAIMLDYTVFCNIKILGHDITNLLYINACFFWWDCRKLFFLNINFYFLYHFFSTSFTSFNVIKSTTLQRCIIFKKIIDPLLVRYTISVIIVMFLLRDFLKERSKKERIQIYAWTDLIK